MFHLCHVVEQFESGLASLEIGKSHRWVDGNLEDFLWRFFRHSLDIHTTFAAEHEYGTFRLAVDNDAHIILGGDVHGLAHQYAVYGEALDVHPQNASGMLKYFGLVAGKFHTARLSAPASVHLRLNHASFCAKFLESLYCLLGRFA